MRKRILALFLTAAMLMSFVPFTLTASAALADDNTVMFSANDDADGKLYYNGYHTYGENGLGYTQKGILRNSTNTGYNTSDGHAYLFSDEIDGENMWKIDFDVDENGNHVKSSGGGTFIYPFYSDTNNPNTSAGAIAAEDIETLGDNYADADEYTHLAIRVKFIDDGSGNYKEGSTQPVSINLLDAASNDGAYGTWYNKGGVYFQDINSGEKIAVKGTTMQIPLGFDGYLVFPTKAVAGTNKTLADLVKVHIFLHWNCNHTSTTYDANNSWVGTELYIGDMILTKNISSFNAVYTAPVFDLTSNDKSITVISDDANALFSLDKDADISTWLAKEAFNATLINLPKGTKYTIYAKYADGTKTISREISTTANGIEGYLMKVPEEDSYFTYSGKCVGWGTRITMTSGQDPFSQSASYNAQGGLYGRKSGDDYFVVMNPQEEANTDGTIKEANVNIYFNTISGRGLDSDGNAKMGMPEGVNPENIEALAIRFKVQGGTANQYSSFSMLSSGYMNLASAYFIDNTTGLIMKPNNISSHRFGVKGEFDGWIVIPYESLQTSNRNSLETNGSAIQFFFHTSGCTSSDHGKDVNSDWSNRVFLLGDMALVANEDDFIRTYSNHSATNGGMAFTRNDAPFVEGKYTEMINTFEATIMLPANFPANIRPGVIYGNYGGQNKALNFEVYTNGNPRVYYQTAIKSGSQSYNKTFTEVNLLNGKKTHIAIVNDQAADTISCYVDGVLAQTLEGAIPDWIPTRPGVIGGDYRDINSLAFCGEMFSVALYSDVRTEAEIQADMANVASDDNLMAHWDLTKAAVDGKLIDESGNGHDAVLGKYWFTDKEPVTDYDYSFALIGDTQIVNIDYYDRLDDIYKWIAANKDSKKIEYVMGLGDVTDANKEREWGTADEAIKLLDGVVPYSLVRGNHDGTALFNSTFDKAPYNTTFAEKYNNLENTYRELVVGDIRYLIFTLDIGAGDDVLEWAGNIIENHPEHNVIITTHIYLDSEGKYITEDSYYRATKYGGKNNGDDIWEKLVSKYENITMAFCGHISQGRAILNQDTGDNGNMVSQLLVDPQGVDANLGATGMVTMLYFSEDGSRVTVETYSTVRDKYYITHGQFDFNVNVIRHTHKGGEATCNTKAVCDYCKEAYGNVDLTKHGTNTELRGVVKPDCKDNGYTGDTWCLDCNTKIADGQLDPATGAHVDADSDWETDGTHHWHICGCGTEFDKDEHTGGTATCKDQKVCDTCKEAYGEVDADAHGTNTELKGVVEAECGVPGYTGDTWCKDCNTEIAKGTATDALTHTGGEATCKDKAICDLCEKAYGEVKADNHKGETEIKDAKPATTTEKGYTGDTVCKDCGEVIKNGEDIPVIVEDNKNDETTPGDDQTGTTPDDDQTGTTPDGEGTGDDENAGAGDENEGTTAPDTGDNASILVAVLMALMAGAVFAISKKRAQNR